MTDNRC